MITMTCLILFAGTEGAAGAGDECFELLLHPAARTSAHAGRMRKTRRAEEMVPSDERPVITLSVIPAIDALVADMSGRGLVAGTEIVDRVDRAANG
jgi:hypothetical protein